MELEPSNYVPMAGYVPAEGFAEVGALLPWALWGGGFWGGIVYASRNNKSKLLYALVGGWAGGMLARVVIAGSK